MNAVQTLYDDAKKRRVVVMRNEDGSFGFEEQRFSDEPREMAWIPVGVAPRPNCHCDTAERAAQEAHARITWLAK
jgi:hypothetical protein